MKGLITLLALVAVVVIGCSITGCGEQERVPEANPYVKEIEVNPIQVETIETETILWENVPVQTWD